MIGIKNIIQKIGLKKNITLKNKVFIWCFDYIKSRQIDILII